MDHKEGLIVGRNAVLQALESGRTIDSVTVAQGQRGGQAGRIIDICRERKIPVKFADQRRLARSATARRIRALRHLPRLTNTPRWTIFSPSPRAGTKVRS